MIELVPTNPRQHGTLTTPAVVCLWCGFSGLVKTGLFDRRFVSWNRSNQKKS